MEHAHYGVEPNFGGEQTETLLLMAVMGQGLLKNAALDELHRRRELLVEEDFNTSFVTNLSGIC